MSHAEPNRARADAPSAHRHDERADPFRERLPRRVLPRKRILGADIRFDSDSEALLSLVETAYGGLPEHRLSLGAPELRIELRLVWRDGMPAADEPPPVRAQGGADLLCGVMDACNYVAIAPAQQLALVVVSADMLERHPYHVRYELIEFAVFVLAARAQALVPLHGACVGRDGRGLLLLGASGAGKSTLALHAWLRGLAFLAEDAVFVQPDTLLATGVGNYLHVKDDALRFVVDAAARDWIRTSPVIRRRSGVAKYEADLRHGAGMLAAAPLKLAGVVMLSERMADDPSRLLRRLPADDVPRLLSADQPYAAAQPGWDRFSFACLALGVHRLERGRHPDDAVAALSALLD